MSDDLDVQADAVARFYKRLTEAGVADVTAGVCAIDLNKVLLSRNVPTLTPSKEEQHDAVVAAVAQKVANRAAARGGT